MASVFLPKWDSPMFPTVNVLRYTVIAPALNNTTVSHYLKDFIFHFRIKLQYPGLQFEEAQYLQCINVLQADCLKHRKEIIQMLKPQEFEQLWTAYLNG